MSLDEWNIHMEGAQQRTEVQYQMLLHLAWHTAHLTRVKVMPSLSAHVKKFAPQKPDKAQAKRTPVQPWQIFRDAMRSKSARQPKVSKPPVRTRKVKT